MLVNRIKRDDKQNNNELNGDAVVSSDTMNDTKIRRNLNITIK